MSAKATKAMEKAGPPVEVMPAPGNPFTFMRRFTEDMDKLFSDFGFGKSFAPVFGFLERELAPAEWSPHLEISQHAGKILVRADLPGMNPEDIQVEITDRLLTLRGERKQEMTEEKEDFYRSERHYGSFYRSFPLPKNVAVDKATASYRKGVLKIDLPLAADQSKVRKLSVSAPETKAA